MITYKNNLKKCNYKQIKYKDNVINWGQNIRSKYIMKPRLLIIHCFDPTDYENYHPYHSQTESNIIIHRLIQIRAMHSSFKNGWILRYDAVSGPQIMESNWRDVDAINHYLPYVRLKLNNSEKCLYKSWFTTALLPTMPVFSPPGDLHVSPHKTSGRCGA